MAFFFILTLTLANDLDLGVPRACYQWIGSINKHMFTCLNYICIFPGSRDIWLFVTQPYLKNARPCCHGNAFSPNKLLLWNVHQTVSKTREPKVSDEVWQNLPPQMEPIGSFWLCGSWTTGERLKYGIWLQIWTCVDEGFIETVWQNSMRLGTMIV